jgi:signal transduction histidine kinase
MIAARTPTMSLVTAAAEFSGDGMAPDVTGDGSRRPPLAVVPVPRVNRVGGVAVAGRSNDAPTIMSASKYSGLSPDRLGPVAVHPLARHGEQGTSVIAQEKVLAEIRHELGNFFHKLYYWSDYLKEKPARQAPDDTAAQMLERTIKNLEDFLRVSLDYFHPVQLTLSRMSVADLLEGLFFQVRAHLNGTPVVVNDGNDCCDAEVLVDPGHLSQAFAVAARHLTKQIGPESTVRVGTARCMRRDRPGVEVGFELHSPSETSPLFRTSEAGVEWAVAQKVIALHGGELSEIVEEGGGKTVTLFLPLSPSGAAEV